jgi:hypothetical protein
MNNYFIPNFGNFDFSAFPDDVETSGIYSILDFKNKEILKFYLESITDHETLYSSNYKKNFRVLENP